MWEYAITQSGPALGTGEICFMAGLKNTSEHVGQFLGAEDTLTQAFAHIAVHAKAIGLREAFTVEYVPWEG